jgi:hypothetical protein
VELQVACGGVAACSGAAASLLLWGLSLAGALQLELWDALAPALDGSGKGLERSSLQHVFEAYCLLLLRVTGPASRPVPPGQLTGAAQAYCSDVLEPLSTQRSTLHDALTAAGLLSGGGGGLTSLSDGHMLLFDAVMPGAVTLLNLIQARWIHCLCVHVGVSHWYSHALADGHTSHMLFKNAYLPSLSAHLQLPWLQGCSKPGSLQAVAPLLCAVQQS